MGRSKRHTSHRKEVGFVTLPSSFLDTLPKRARKKRRRVYDSNGVQEDRDTNKSGKHNTIDDPDAIKHQTELTIDTQGKRIVDATRDMEPANLPQTKYSCTGDHPVVESKLQEQFDTANRDLIAAQSELRIAQDKMAAQESSAVRYVFATQNERIRLVAINKGMREELDRVRTDADATKLQLQSQSERLEESRQRSHAMSKTFWTEVERADIGDEERLRKIGEVLGEGFGRSSSKPHLTTSPYSRASFANSNLRLRDSRYGEREAPDVAESHEARGDSHSS
ncbi:hypothetical protein T440DRAFT_475808 [Plenodomus tracheiphilus IPT5]|uniref:Uncharacterized protein n=1 Tax=Plenodomus tracheiphilus IPT5 TaxID=1408161 RepID=A0A6A7BJW5_9PLEO|nr:hypothetical protein T440DRAFT_475808 [Plenodomus tracheiphilus IPT5]